MNDYGTHMERPLWTRPQLDRTGPVRISTGIYRTTDGPEQGIGGIPLTSVEDAAVAAVRMGYRVAEAQIERSTRLADRLRKATGRSVGPDSESKAVDATEQLVFKAIMSALAWLEAAAAEGDSPLKRLVVAQYKLLGTLLGLTSNGAPAGGKGRTQTSDIEEVLRAAVQSMRASSVEGEGKGATQNRQQNASFEHICIILKGENTRPVTILRWELSNKAPLEYPVRFYSTSQPSPVLRGRVVVDEKETPTLIVETQSQTPFGVWRGAVCDAEGRQLGRIEIEH